MPKFRVKFPPKFSYCIQKTFESEIRFEVNSFLFKTFKISHIILAFYITSTLFTYLLLSLSIYSGITQLKYRKLSNIPLIRGNNSLEQIITWCPPSDPPPCTNICIVLLIYFEALSKTYKRGPNIAMKSYSLIPRSVNSKKISK